MDFSQIEQINSILQKIPCQSYSLEIKFNNTRFFIENKNSEIKRPIGFKDCEVKDESNK
jgi:hypothetical protein